ncbi:MAG: ABC transporter permease [Desulfatiglans sp.]|nr:ABC transporter permease [Desulfatiglans sp.]
MAESIRLNGILTALKSECFVLIRSRTSLLLIIIPVVAAILKMCMVRLQGIGTQVMSSVNSNVESSVTGYGYMVDGLSTGITVACLLLLGFSAYIFAIDNERGITRHSIVKSISRSEIVIAKYLVLCLMAFVSILITILCTWLTAGLFWELGPVIEDGYQIICVDEIKKEIFLGLKLALLPIPACLGFGLIFSVLARSAIQAVSLAIGAGLLLDIFKSLFGRFTYFIFSSFQPALNDHSYLKDVQRIVSGYSDVLVDDRIHQLNLWVPIPEAIILLIISLIIINRRSL